MPEMRDNGRVAQLQVDQTQNESSYGQEEQKIMSRQPAPSELGHQKRHTPSNVRSPGNGNGQPYNLIEGPEPSQDLSYKWVAKYENVGEIEKGVPLPEFQESMEARDLDAEFRLLRKLTETKEHQENLETIEKRKSSLLNRYAELKPCKWIIDMNCFLILELFFIQLSIRECV